MSLLIGAIDQGTTSSRFMLLDRDARVVACAQREHETFTPRPGWVEQDAGEIWRRVGETIDEALAAAGATASDVAAIGIANQRETTVLWDRSSGEPVGRAISWQDTRTDALVRSLGAPDRLRALTGLPLSTYFSGPKISWMLDEVSGARERAEAGELAFGTIDSWLLWNLTGGDLHATDPGNASRTLLLDLRTLDWSEECLRTIGVPRALLAEVRSSSEVYGEARTTALAGRPVAALLGDQQAALFGQTCFNAGECKCTYGTGSFLVANTGGEICESDALLSSVGYRLGDGAAAYVLEGSMAFTGALVQWLRDRLGIISSAAEIEELAASVPDTGGVYLVPAFSGLFAPHWRADARGTIVGLTAFAGRPQIARAALEAVAWQTRDVVDAIRPLLGAPLRELRVDGGMTSNALLMQMQADFLGTPVVRPAIRETTALGAAFAAGLAVGFWSDTDELRERWSEDRRWEPALGAAQRERRHGEWGRAVERSLGWA